MAPLDMPRSFALATRGARYVFQIDEWHPEAVLLVHGVGGGGAGHYAAEIASAILVDALAQPLSAEVTPVFELAHQRIRSMTLDRQYLERIELPRRHFIRHQLELVAAGKLTISAGAHATLLRTDGQHLVFTGTGDLEPYRLAGDALESVRGLAADPGGHAWMLRPSGRLLGQGSEPITCWAHQELARPGATYVLARSGPPQRLAEIARALAAPDRESASRAVLARDRAESGFAVVVLGPDSR